MSVVHPLPPFPVPDLGFREETRNRVVLRRLCWSLLLATAALLLMPGGDEWVADILYRWQGSQWAAQEAWWASQLLHRGGRNASIGMAALVLGLWLFACCTPRGQRWRKPLLYLFLVAALSTGLVSLLKHATHMDCPWDLYRYGGTRPWVGLFESRPADLGNAACFPSGHASAGYCWIGLYFVALTVCKRLRHPALALVLVAGMVFGFTQQLRGAHFLSHDLVTLAICWTVAAVLFALMFRREMQA